MLSRSLCSFSATISLSSALYVESLEETSESNAPIIFAAKIPAFLAPFSATVATGIPQGICNIDKTESHPSIELLDLIGTPITGSVVMLAVIPGR